SLVEALLPPQILVAGAVGRDLDDQAGDMALFLPELVDPALPLRDAPDHEDVRGDDGTRISFFEVEEHVPPGVNVRRSAETLPQGLDEIDRLVEVVLGFRHGLAVGFRVDDLALERNRAHACHPFPGRYGVRARPPAEAQLPVMR